MFCGTCGAAGATGNFCGSCGAQVGDSIKRLPEQSVRIRQSALARPSAMHDPDAAINPAGQPTSLSRRVKAERVGLLAVVLVAVGLAVVAGRAATSGGLTDDPLYQVGYREAYQSSVLPEQVGGAGGICHGLVSVSDASNPEWATDRGKQAYFEGCMAGYAAK